MSNSLFFNPVFPKYDNDQKWRIVINADVNPQKDIYSRSTLAGDFMIVNKHLYRDLRSMNLWNKDIVNKIPDRFTRLWNEVEYSLQIAAILSENGIKPNYIDLDLNPDPKYKSNQVLRAALGYVESMGYTPRCKPEAIVASYVADAICK